MYDPNNPYGDDPQDPNTVDPNTGQPQADQTPAATAPKTGYNPTAGNNDSGAVKSYYWQFLGRDPTEQEVNSQLQGGAGDLNTIQNSIANSAEAQAYAKKNGFGAQPAAPAKGIFGAQNQWSGLYPGTNLKQDPRFSDLVNTLLDRSKKSLHIDPTTDEVIRPQVDNYAAQQERQRRTYLNELAESNSPYATGAMDNARTQTSEAAGMNTANMESALMSNELTSRRKEIQDALSEAGTLLTGDQQMQLQHELGLIDAQLKQQGITNQNDQFFANLGLETQDRGNYWDALRRGLLK